MGHIKYHRYDTYFFLKMTENNLQKFIERLKKTYSFFIEMLIALNKVHKCPFWGTKFLCTVDIIINDCICNIRCFCFKRKQSFFFKIVH